MFPAWKDCLVVRVRATGPGALFGAAPVSPSLSLIAEQCAALPPLPGFSPPPDRLQHGGFDARRITSNMSSLSCQQSATNT